MSTISDFANSLLQALGAPATSANVQSIEDWAAQEGGGGANNPLNTTLQTSGSTGSINSVGVQNYASTADGVAATAQTLQGSAYSSIVSALQSGAGLIGNTAAGISSGLSTWSGGGYSSVGGATESGGTAVAGGSGSPGSTGTSSGGTAAPPDVTTAQDTALYASLDAINIPGWSAISSVFSSIFNSIAAGDATSATGQAAAGAANTTAGAASLGGITSALTAIGQGFTILASAMTKFLKVLEWFYTPSNWVRIIAFITGVFFLLPGLYALLKTGSGGPYGDAALAMGILMVTIAGCAFFVAFHNLPTDVNNFQALLAWISEGIRTGTAPTGTTYTETADITPDTSTASTAAGS